MTLKQDIEFITSKINLGIKGKLHLSFFIIVAITLFLGAISWILFQKSSYALNFITNDVIPVLRAAEKITLTGSQLAAETPFILHSRNREDLDKHADELISFVKEQKKLIEKIKNSQHNKVLMEKLLILIESVERKLFMLEYTMLDLLNTRHEGTVLKALLQNTHNDIITETTQILDDLYFQLMIDTKKIQVDVEFNKYKSYPAVDLLSLFLELKAEANLSLSALASVLNTNTPSRIVTFEDQFYAAKNEMKKIKEEISKYDNEELRALSIRIERFIAHDLLGRNIFDLRRQELIQMKNLDNIIASIKFITEEIGKTEKALSEQINIHIKQLSDNANHSLTVGKHTMVFLTCLCVLIAFLIAWFYVGNNIIRRITALYQSMKAISNGELTVPIPSEGSDEITDMADAVAIFKNSMIDNIKLNQDLSAAKERAEEAREKLRQLNIELENRVATRTEELSLANAHLKDTLAELQFIQDELVESEKMASLGRLVSGISHEINTPVGNAVTIASDLKDKIEIMNNSLKDGKLSKNAFVQFVDTGIQMSDLILLNLSKASDLVQKFKKVAIEESGDNLELINLYKLLLILKDEVQSKFPEKQFELKINVEQDLSIKSYAEALSHIFTSLMINSILHGFKGREDNIITFNATMLDNKLQLIYQDNGHGMNKEVLDKLFDPFFTTDRSHGTGLGMHIVYNLVTQKLKGRIHCESELGKGVTFVMLLPINA